MKFWVQSFYKRLKLVLKPNDISTRNINSFITKYKLYTIIISAGQTGRDFLHRCVLYPILRHPPTSWWIVFSFRHHWYTYIYIYNFFYIRSGNSCIQDTRADLPKMRLSIVIQQKHTFINPYERLTTVCTCLPIIFIKVSFVYSKAFGYPSV